MEISDFRQLGSIFFAFFGGAALMYALATVVVGRGGAGRESTQQRKLAGQFADKLEAFLAKATGDDRFNARLMLVGYRLSLGEREKAEATQRIPLRTSCGSQVQSGSRSSAWWRR